MTKLTKMLSLPEELILKIMHDLSMDDLLNFAEISPKAMRIFGDFTFHEKKHQHMKKMHLECLKIKSSNTILLNSQRLIDKDVSNNLQKRIRPLFDFIDSRQYMTQKLPSMWIDQYIIFEYNEMDSQVRLCSKQMRPYYCDNMCEMPTYYPFKVTKDTTIEIILKIMRLHSDGDYMMDVINVLNSPTKLIIYQKVYLNMCKNN